MSAHVLLHLLKDLGNTAEMLCLPSQILRTQNVCSCRLEPNLRPLAPPDTRQHGRSKLAFGHMPYVRKSHIIICIFFV